MQPARETRDDDGDAVETGLKGCELVYDQLQDCLAANNRNWAACSKELTAWKTCMRDKPTSSESQAPKPAS